MNMDIEENNKKENKILENLKQELYSCESIYQAFNLFDQHKFKKSQLLEIAEYLGVSVSKYSDKAEITRKIVYGTVAEKLKDDTIRKRNIAKYRKTMHEENDDDIAILNQKFLYEKLRQLREKKYTQSELAKILNLTTETINKWETGEREPSSTNLRKLLAALEISIDDLFGFPDTIQDENEETISPNIEPAKPVKFVPCKHCGKPTLEGNKFCHACTWDAKWAKHILNSPELERRRKRSHSTKILSIDRDKGEAIFKSSRNTQTYTTTLKNCTCRDFALGHDAWPCKHILRLAEELGLFQNEYFTPDEYDYTMQFVPNITEIKAAEQPKNISEPEYITPPVEPKHEELPVIINKKPSIFLKILKYISCASIGAFIMLCILGTFTRAKIAPRELLIPVLMLASGYIIAINAKHKGLEGSMFSWIIYGTLVPVVSWMDVLIAGSDSQNRVKIFIKSICICIVCLVFYMGIFVSLIEPHKNQEITQTQSVE